MKKSTTQVRVFLSLHRAQAGVQVLQLLLESNVELLQEGGVPGSRRALCVEEVEALLDPCPAKSLGGNMGGPKWTLHNWWACVAAVEH